jgi:hypothetical protein
MMASGSRKIKRRVPTAAPAAAVVGYNQAVDEHAGTNAAARSRVIDLEA